MIDILGWIIISIPIICLISSIIYYVLVLWKLAKESSSGIYTFSKIHSFDKVGKYNKSTGVIYSVFLYAVPLLTVIIYIWISDSTISTFQKILDSSKYIFSMNSILATISLFVNGLSLTVYSEKFLECIVSFSKKFKVFSRIIALVFALVSGGISIGLYNDALKLFFFDDYFTRLLIWIPVGFFICYVILKYLSNMRKYINTKE